MKQAVLLAGGKGSRLSSVFSGLPKPMVPIAGKPVLEYAVEQLVRANITDVHFFNGYESQVISNHFGDGSAFGITPTYHVEQEPLGTAGAVVQALADLDDEFLVVYGDLVFNVDLQKFAAFHTKNNADMTLFLHPNDHPHDSDLIDVDGTGRVTALHACPHPKEAYVPNMVSGALYIIKKEILQPWAAHKGPIDFAHDIIPALIQENKRVFGYVSREYLKDMGTPERFKKAEADMLSGKITRGSLATKKPAIFIDRDGTLVTKAGYIALPENIHLEERSAEAIKLINKSEYLAVLVTNQPVIARGEVTEEGLRQIHNKMEQDLGAEGAYLNAIYFCPHHPAKGFEGERPGYKIICDCRKPEIELVTRAAADMNIDMEHSWFVGDTTVDMQTAQNAGLKSVLVKTGEGGTDAKFDSKPDFEAANLLEAVKLILSN